MSVVLDDGDLLFRSFAGMHFSDAQLAREVSYFGLTITREQNDFRSLMSGLQMMHEGMAVSPRLIVKTQGGGVLAIHIHQALEASRGWRQRRRELR